MEAFFVFVLIPKRKEVVIQELWISLLSISGAPKAFFEERRKANV
jgi:hypothetical protein